MLKAWEMLRGGLADLLLQRNNHVANQLGQPFCGTAQCFYGRTLVAKGNTDLLEGVELPELPPRRQGNRDNRRHGKDDRKRGGKRSGFDKKKDHKKGNKPYYKSGRNNNNNKRRK